MKIVIEYQERSTIAKFANKHKLVMKVHERDAETLRWHSSLNSSYFLPKFWAEFEDAETLVGSILTSSSGDGNTVAEAIEDYAKQISGQLLVIHAGDKKKRKEIRVPILIKGK